MPLLALTLAILYREILVKKIRVVVLACIIGIIIALPAVFATFSSQGLMRLSGTTAFSGDHPYYAESVERYAQALEKNNAFERIYYSRKFTHVKVFAAQYVSHFAPAWLFSGAARENHKVPFTGLLYGIEAPFLLYGLFLAVTKFRSREVGVIGALLFFSPLPAAVTTQAPHAMRAYTMLPSFVILTGLGFSSALAWIRASSPSLFGIARLAVIPLILALVSAGQNYFIMFPKTQSDSFQYALHKALVFAGQHEKEVDRVIVSNQHNLYQSYMFYLFENKYDPELYVKNGGTVSGGYARMHTIGSYEFRPVVWDNDKELHNVLILADVSEVPESSSSAVFANLDGTEAVVGEFTK